MYEAVGASLGGLVNPATGTAFAPVDTAAHLEELWFLLMLGTDAFAPANDWWLALGTGQFHQQAQAVIEHRYKWQHLAERPEDALAAAKALYAAGIIEDRKRSGYECSCGAALALFEAMARDDGRHLAACPRCGHSWTDPTAAPGVTTYACGECQAPVRATQDRCRHCGVLLDFVSPPGTRTTVFRRETTTTYRHYGWADPFCPWVDYPRFTLLARPIIVIA
jgi:DNA-directed RNA polymerase subunit RPC12/RpoP